MNSASVSKANSAKMRFTVLGCGSSPGVPRIGGDWGNCDSGNPKNRRFRSSLLVERIDDDKKTVVVVDTGPDFRQQMLQAEVAWADGVIYTHAHADHVHGIDELRSFLINRRQLVDIWADLPTSERLHESFDYCFSTPDGSKYPPILVEHRIVAGEKFNIDGDAGAIEIQPFEQQHGDIVSLGFRFGGFGYCSDVSAFDERALPHLQNLDVLVIDALQHKPHRSHFSLEQALEWIERLKPRHAILTHMHTPLDYQTVMDQTPSNVEPAYDGMVIELDAVTNSTRLHGSKIIA